MAKDCRNAVLPSVPSCRKNIKVGEEVDYYTEVTGGDLKEGDQLIYDNTFSVTEGQVFTPEQIYSNQALDTEGMMSTEAE